MPKKLAQVCTAIAMVLALAAAPAAAKSAKSPPDPAANPVLAKLSTLNTRLYYMGSQSGLDGWLIVKDGQVQMAYAPAGNDSLLIGALFDADGNNVTALQIKTLAETNKEVGDFFKNAAASQNAAMPMPGVTTPVSAANAPVLKPYEPPGDRLMQALREAAGVNIGAAGAPQILMVMDPNCPHCQATWKALREFVLKRQLQIRMVPIANPDSDDERAAARLLRVAEPLQAWDKYVEGDKEQLAGAAETGQIAALRANHVLIDSWHIGVTPYIVYRAKDGQVKIVQGKIKDAASVMNDLTP